MEKPPIKSYRDLIVWQKAMDLIDLVEEIVMSLMPYQRSWLGSQMLRAALSIPSNIAEGHTADYQRVYLRHLSDAKGSTAEVETQLLVIDRRGYGQQAARTRALDLCDEIGRMLNGLSRSVRRSKTPRGTHRPNP